MILRLSREERPNEIRKIQNGRISHLNFRSASHCVDSSSHLFCSSTFLFFAIPTEWSASFSFCSASMSSCSFRCLFELSSAPVLFMTLMSVRAACSALLNWVMRESCCFITFCTISILRVRVRNRGEEGEGYMMCPRHIR